MKGKMATSDEQRQHMLRLTHIKRPGHHTLPDIIMLIGGFIQELAITNQSTLGHSHRGDERRFRFAHEPCKFLILILY